MSYNVNQFGSLGGGSSGMSGMQWAQMISALVNASSGQQSTVPTMPTSSFDASSMTAASTATDGPMQGYTPWSAYPTMVGGQVPGATAGVSGGGYKAYVPSSGSGSGSSY